MKEIRALIFTFLMNLSYDRSPDRDANFMYSYALETVVNLLINSMIRYFASEYREICHHFSSIGHAFIRTIHRSNLSLYLAPGTDKHVLIQIMR